MSKIWTANIQFWHLRWVPVPFFMLSIDFFNFFPFQGSNVYFSVLALSTLSFSFPVIYSHHAKVLDAGLTVFSCLNQPLAHLSISVSVSTVSRVRQCVPSTWSSWPGCSMGGSRSRNHLSLFGRLFQMKSSRSQGADGCNQCVHLCWGCYQITVRRKRN